MRHLGLLTIVAILAFVAVVVWTIVSHRRYARDTDRAICAHCGRALPGFAKFCSQCGTPVSRRASR